MNKVEEELLAAVRAINTSMLASDGHTTISIKWKTATYWQ